MQIVDCEQGSEEWHLARLGVVTASMFKVIMTDPKSKADKTAGKLSQSAVSYQHTLIAEKLLLSHREINAKSLDWGNLYEPQARQDYIFDNDGEVIEVGFVLHDNGLIGASPDGLVNDDGGIEIKCPENPAVHVQTIFGGMDKEHLPQVQGGLWICEREWWDFISYRPDMPVHLRSHVERIYRDDDYIKAMAKKVHHFVDLLNEKMDKLNSLA